MFPGDMRLCHSTYFLIEKNPCPELQTWLQTEGHLVSIKKTGGHWRLKLIKDMIDQPM